MKHIAIWLPALLCSIVGFSQAGLYKSADDFLNGKLEHTPQEFQRHKLRTDLPFNRYVVRVVDGNESHKYFKWDLYGYKNRRNENFRIFNERSYRIIDTAMFVIYAREENIVRGKEKTRETRYYFSKNAESRIIPLTIRNLKYAYPNREFHDLLDAHFRSNHELMRYDAHNGEYKIKRLYTKTLSS
jgi:hypothetical protein